MGGVLAQAGQSQSTTLIGDLQPSPVPLGQPTFVSLAPCLRCPARAVLAAGLFTAGPFPLAALAPGVDGVILRDQPQPQLQLEPPTRPLGSDPRDAFPSASPAAFTLGFPFPLAFPFGTTAPSGVRLQLQGDAGRRWRLNWKAPVGDHDAAECDGVGVGSPHGRADLGLLPELVGRLRGFQPPVSRTVAQGTERPLASEPCPVLIQLRSCSKRLPQHQRFGPLRRFAGGSSTAPAARESRGKASARCLGPCVASGHPRLAWR